VEKPYPPVEYQQYLELARLLDSQRPKSVEYGRPAHDELLFIVVHQVYELWFKQILHELDSVASLFQQDSVDERNIGVAVSRLARVTEIQKLLVDQLRVLETMTPLDFLDFRDMLLPASGFQSQQFRRIESRLGVRRDQPSLFDLVEKWLERTPFLELPGFQFWASYRAAVERMLADDRRTIETHPALTPEERGVQLAELDRTRGSFEALLDEPTHERLRAEGARRLSHRATLAALLIQLYRDQPILHLPFRFLTLLVDVDELLATWRYRHALMVHRMIGTKIGTGGSSGHHYLMGTVERNKVFTDLFNLSTFLIPRSALPDLPPDLERRLGFYFPRE
jgi:tryptophan 2,3-dioxygenase